MLCFKHLIVGDLLLMVLVIFAVLFNIHVVSNMVKHLNNCIVSSSPNVLDLIIVVCLVLYSSNPRIIQHIIVSDLVSASNMNNVRSLVPLVRLSYRSLVVF